MGKSCNQFLQTSWAMLLLRRIWVGERLVMGLSVSLLTLLLSIILALWDKLMLPIVIVISNLKEKKQLWIEIYEFPKRGWIIFVDI